MKAKVILKETYRKGVLIGKADIIINARNSTEIHVKEKGKMSDGKEFITVTIFV